jgi:hypothetical protein
MFQRAMPRLSLGELRFKIKRALQEIPKATRRDLVGKQEAYERGIERATDLVLARFEECEVMEPDRTPMDFGDMKT